jgi:HEAT repeat protein
VRARAAELTADLPGDVDPPLVPILDDGDPAVVEAAAWASGERRPPEPGVVAALAAVTTGHDDPICREAAVAALGAIGDPVGLPAVLAATTDRPAIRRRAVLALAPFAGPDVEAALERALADRDWQVRQAAEDVSR